MGKRRELKFKQHRKLKIPRKKPIFVDAGVEDRIKATFIGTPEVRKKVATKPSKEMEKIWEINELNARLKESESKIELLFKFLRDNFGNELAEVFFDLWEMGQDPFQVFEKEPPPKPEPKPLYTTKEELEAHKAILKEKREKTKKTPTMVDYLLSRMGGK